MLKNHYDSLLIGKGFITLLAALKNIESKKSVLLVDDQYFQTVSNQTDYVSDLELTYMSQIGARYNLSELQQMNDSLSLRPYQLHGNGVSVLLGMNPHHNAKELWRKMGSFLTPENMNLLLGMPESEFQSWYEGELSRFTQELRIAFQKNKAVRFTFQGPKYLLDWIDGMKKWLARPYPSNDFNGARVFVHLSSTLFEDKIKKYLDDSEFPFYFLRWLSPLYQLDNDRLGMRLEKSLSDRGGDVKRTSIQDWQIHKNQLFHVLLSTYEGVVSMDQATIFGHLPENAPFISVNPHRVFQFASVGDLSDEEIGSPHSFLELHFLTDTDRLGGERPLRSFVFNQNGIRAYYPYLRMPGARAEFSRDVIYQDVMKDFARFNLKIQKISFNPHGRQLLEVNEPHSKEAFGTYSWPLSFGDQDGLVSGLEYQGLFQYQRFGIIGHLLSIL